MLATLPAAATAPLCSPTAARTIAFRSAASLADDRVRLGDIADLSAIPATLRGKALALVVDSGVHDGDELAIAPMLATLRGRMPILACWLPGAAHGSITAHVPMTAAAAQIAPPVVAADPGGVKRGDPVNLTVSVGAVRIERQVEALQPAEPGQRLFVRDASGATLSVRYVSAPR